VIVCKSPREIEQMRRANVLVAEVLAELASMVAPGVTTADLDAKAEQLVRAAGAEPAFKGYRGYPATLCASVNDEVVHGIPAQRALAGGDIISLDMGVKLDGFYGDSAVTVPVGQVSEDVQRLPFDHHMVLGLVAPRALFVLDNTDMMWLGDESSFTNLVAASEIWKGLGAADAMGASQVGGHPHCRDVPQPQLDELGAFVDKFLLEKRLDKLLDKNGASTSVLRSDRISPDRARWIPWSTPELK